MILTNLLRRLLWDALPSAREPNQWLERGRRYEHQGQLESARKMFERALRAVPDHVEAHYLLGCLHGKNGELRQATYHLERAIAGNPGLANAHAALGNVRLLQDDKPGASASYRASLSLAPDNAVAHANLGLIYQVNGEYSLALRHLMRAHELAPEQPGVLKNLTLTWIALEQFDEARSRLREFLGARPDHFETLTCLGFVLQKMHHPDLALEMYQKASRQNDSDPELLNNYGVVLQDLGRLDDAIRCYDAAIDLKPAFELARWHRSLAYLLNQDFGRGWPDYELRRLSIDQPQRPQLYPQWDGSDLAGRGVLLYGEQGLGDEIMFASCVPQVIAMSKQCVLECSPKLEALFRRSFPAATVYAQTDAGKARSIPEHAGIEVQTATGSLPRYLRQSRNEFPQHHGYLKADPEHMRLWQTRLAALGAGLKVGISWQGGTFKTRRKVRSVPLASWLPILRTPDVRFVNLQYAHSTADIAELNSAGIEISDWPEAHSDYDQTAALVSALDLVISVCTAVIHLGGALGKPVWVIAPYSPEWRYGIAGEKMPWYPSARVFRQPAYGEWEPVIDKVACELRKATLSQA